MDRPTTAECSDRETTAKPTTSKRQNTILTRRYRVFVLRKFLLKTYGDYLRDGPVFDVAGGKGDLAWLLLNIDGIDSVVVDPRITDHTKLVRAAEWLLAHPAEAKERADPAIPGHQALAAFELKPPFQPARHLRLFVDDELVDAVSDCTKSHRGSGKGGEIQHRWETYFQSGIERAKAAEGERGHHQPKGWDRALDGDAGLVRCPEEAKTLLTSPHGVVVGFHPDEATEPCNRLCRRPGPSVCGGAMLRVSFALPKSAPRRPVSVVVSRFPGIHSCQGSNRSHCES